MADENPPEENEVPETGPEDGQPESGDWTDSRGRASGGDEDDAQARFGGDDGDDNDGPDPSAANIHTGDRDEWEAAPMASGPEEGTPRARIEVPHRETPEGTPPDDISPPEIGGPADYVDTPEPEFAWQTFPREYDADADQVENENPTDRLEDLQASSDIIEDCRTANTAMQVLTRAEAAHLPLADKIAELAQRHATDISGGDIDVEILIFDRSGGLVGKNNG